MADKVKAISHYKLEDLTGVAKEIIAFGHELNIWIFVGEMGVGKTTLIKEICEVFGVNDLVHSPTYSLVNEYELLNNDTLYHFDFYRLKDETEALDIGVEEYFYSGKRCLIEWPEKIPSLLPEKHLNIELSLADYNLRSIFLSKHDQYTQIRP